MSLKEFINGPPRPDLECPRCKHSSLKHNYHQFCTTKEPSVQRQDKYGLWYWSNDKCDCLYSQNAIEQHYVILKQRNIKDAPLT